MANSELIRLNKYIADSGVCSRRAADRLIEEGAVQVNRRKVYEHGVKIDPSVDQVLVNGKPIRAQNKNAYYAFHKPKGVLTSLKDPEGRPTVADFFKRLPVRLFPVGRLDWDSEGLLLLTNDGDFSHEVSHPKSEVTKTYLVKLSGEPTPEQIEKLKTGVSIPGGRVRALRLEKVPKTKGKYPWYKIVITEGKNRQIRLMFSRIGIDVSKLQRIGIGKLRLGTLQRGELLPLTSADLRKVFIPDVRKPKPAPKKTSIKRKTKPKAKP